MEIFVKKKKNSVVASHLKDELLLDSECADEQVLLLYVGRPARQQLWCHPLSIHVQGTCRHGHPL